MEELKQLRSEILDKINKCDVKKFKLQNELLNIEQSIINLGYNDIIETLTLNEQQLNIINSDEQNVLVIACAGSGKTHTLISRYIKLVVEDNVQPDNVLLITFTKKAGQEMLERLSSYIPTKLPLYVGSLHGLSYRVLQTYNKINYTILDEKESNQMIKDITNKYIDSENSDLLTIKFKIINIIDKASTLYPFDLLKVTKKYLLEKYYDTILLIYNKYQQRKQSEQLVDFNDLMHMFASFLDSEHSVAFKEKIKYIFFDEYQDVNMIQHYILSKFLNYSKIMAVGDDAQSIYAFRGSSVDYILNFTNDFKPNKIYLLENNYRSTSQIVNFFQDIIVKNINQYDKNVKSLKINDNVKPTIIGFDNNTTKDKWIINDIIKNKNNGVDLSKMVILARKNDSLDRIEIELMKKGITVMKHSGLSILDKHHIKDFIAFIIVSINDKSSIHWKRILALHIDINMAHNIIETAIIEGHNIRETIKKIKSDSIQQLDIFLDYINNNNSLNTMKDIDKAKNILNYLEKLWSSKKKIDTHIDEKIRDIMLLIKNLSTSTFKDFINEIYLNQTIETNMSNTLYLTTIHGSKGLEWEYVYIIDVDTDNFPNVKYGFFIDECEEMEEERRMFYVACSRAKTNLTITYNYSFNPSSLLLMSPFIRELDRTLYNNMNVDYTTYKMSGSINMDVNNYLKYFGFSKLYPIYKKLNYEEINLHNMFEIPKYLDKIKYTKTIINNFFDYMINKMIQINFSKKIQLNINRKLEKMPQKIRQNYIDELNDWRNLLNDIFFMATYNINDDSSVFDDIKNILINDNIYLHYEIINKSLLKYIKTMKPKKIISHYNAVYAQIKGDINLLVDNNIFEIKTNQFETTSMSNLTQILIHGYLLNRNNIQVNNIILYNPLKGNIVKFNTIDINFKEIATIVYGHFSTNQ